MQVRSNMDLRPVSLDFSPHFPATIMQLPASLSRHLSALRALAHQAREQSTSPHGNHKTLPNRLADVLVRTWDLGFTSFGGPAVHFQILRQRFVEGRGGKQKWVDEQTVRCVVFPAPGGLESERLCTSLVDWSS